jgi:hypothetical protein
MSGVAISRSKSMVPSWIFCASSIQTNRIHALAGKYGSITPELDTADSLSHKTKHLTPVGLFQSP